MQDLQSTDQPRKHVLDYADFTCPARQHMELSDTDNIGNRAALKGLLRRDHDVGIDDLSDLFDLLEV